MPASPPAFRKGLSRSRLCRGPQRRDRVPLRRTSQNDRLPRIAAELVEPALAVIVASGAGRRSRSKARRRRSRSSSSSVGDPVSSGLSPAWTGRAATSPADHLERRARRRSGSKLLADRPAIRPRDCSSIRTNPDLETLIQRCRRRPAHCGVAAPRLSRQHERDIAAAFATSSGCKPAAVIGTDPFFTTQSRQLAALSMQHALPTIYQYREFVSDGGLISYGGSLADVYRQAGTTPAASSRARSPPTCRSSSPPRSS